MVMVLEPTFRFMFPEAEADVTALPLTVMVAPLSLLVGVTVIEVMPLATDAV
jgi:hypothetical protein